MGKKLKIAVFGKTVEENFIRELERIANFLQHEQVEVVGYGPFCEYLEKEKGTSFHPDKVFTTPSDLDPDCDFFFSIGGDGTFLDGVSLVRNTGIPMVGINHGRLGFLADIPKEELKGALQAILDGDYRIEERTLLRVKCDSGCFRTFPFGLNDFTVHKQDTSQVIQVETYVDDEFLTTFWSDGLIVSTATGSTAYSLSVGGPVLAPNTNSLVLTAIAPHHLTVRPLVVSDSAKIKLKITGRGERIMASIDARSFPVDMGSEFVIDKAPFVIKVLKLSNVTFYDTLRNKLMWGADKRN
ncbi:NAD kinase [Halosquirtibacter laminarini]|uniref:NAD kinase n=1 Tax=Halosquirtibacter laminarini TaxID=3374600 RepID=A0AC61NLD9_9BACT|nr:NAD kinase [Prolixibacteraceae bacterium]